MSLLSRLRGSKGYGACRDAASPRADQASEARAISASTKKKSPAGAGLFFLIGLELDVSDFASMELIDTEINPTDELHVQIPLVDHKSAGERDAADLCSLGENFHRIHADPPYFFAIPF